jgi:enoyl-CoA hydratase/carnithine racemase
VDHAPGVNVGRHASRPDQRNAINASVAAALAEVLAELDESADLS